MSSVVERMRCVGGHIHRVARSSDEMLVTKGDLDFSLENAKHLFEVVTVGWWATSRGNVHINERVLVGRLLAAHEDGVGITDEAEVRERGIVIGTGDRQLSKRIVGRYQELTFHASLTSG